MHQATLQPNTKSILLGALAAPWVLIAWTNLQSLFFNPYWGQSNPLGRFFDSVILFYALFLIYAAICHLILRAIKATSLKSYVLCMFLLTSVIGILSSTYALSGFTSFTAETTNVVEADHITLAGYLYIIKICLSRAALYALAFAVFWKIAVQKKLNEGTR